MSRLRRGIGYRGCLKYKWRKKDSPLIRGESFLLFYAADERG